MLLALKIAGYVFGVSLGLAVLVLAGFGAWVAIALWRRPL